MKKHAMLMSGLCSAALMVLFAVSRPLIAEPIGPHSPGNVQKGCNATGGVYFPPTKGNSGEYGCLNQNATSIVCGGAGGYKKTCSYGKQGVPGRSGMPTREQFDQPISAPRMNAK
jgi:hypothetical protein